ncbi:TolB family protein [Kordiimonas lacus]|uniref:WD40-like Beta Propeller Repeat n=1 Tax=Kordiimonas lacus TaxID=637679 RepID=A0A1G6UJS1_9PROT|nr:PD40 domain-containing protein [Kordiimonas lacus]SDD41602.1 WD40-like Beta Propeller Repeat [Kordiimonas lacus]
MKSISKLVILLSVSVGGSAHAGDTAPVAEGPLLGQQPPGPEAEIFAPGIVNADNFESKEGMFAGDMNSFYFVKGDKDGPYRALVHLEKKGNQWHQSVALEGETEPSFSPDGKTLYFQTKYMERTGSGWTGLQSLGAPFADLPIMRLSGASSGTYYFDTFSPELDIPVRYSRRVGDQYEEPQELGPQFAVGIYNAHPFIAPDESYIIWDSRRDGGYGTSDLYISFRQKDGAWGPAINMGDKINSEHAENYPSVSPDGKYLFFDRRIGTGPDRTVAIYWVDAGIIEDLRPD